MARWGTRDDGAAELVDGVDDSVRVRHVPDPLHRGRRSDPIVKEAVARDFEWLLLLEDEVIPPIDLLMSYNRKLWMPLRTKAAYLPG